MKMTKLFYACTTLSILAGCGGGGGGTNIREFTSWSAVEPGTTVRINAMTREATATFNGELVSAITPLSAVTTNSSVTMTFDSNGDATGLAITTPLSSVSFSTANGDMFGNIYPELIGVASQDASKAALAADPYYLGWDYQSFGIWFTNDLWGEGTVGVMSLGAPTSGDAIPTSGTATYLGMTGGMYLDPAGNQYFTFSDMTVDANFGTRSLAFATSDTYISQDLIVDVSAPELDLTGTLTYSAGTNSFSGTVDNGDALSGTANGRFYGPVAEELGGVFALTSGNGVETYGGGFGGVRGAILPP